MAGKKKHEDRAFAVPVALFYGALFIVYGTHIPFMPVWLDWRGLTAGEISTVMACALLPSSVRDAERRRCCRPRQCRHRRYLIALAWLSLVFVLALAAATVVLADPALRRADDDLQFDEHAADRDHCGPGHATARTRLRPHAALGLAHLRRGEFSRWYRGYAVRRRRRSMARGHRYRAHRGGGACSSRSEQECASDRCCRQRPIPLAGSGTS